MRDNGAALDAQKPSIPGPEYVGVDGHPAAHRDRHVGFDDHAVRAGPTWHSPIPRGLRRASRNR
jgi:hypothetical protein